MLLFVLETSYWWWLDVFCLAGLLRAGRCGGQTCKGSSEGHSAKENVPKTTSNHEPRQQQQPQQQRHINQRQQHIFPTKRRHHGQLASWSALPSEGCVQVPGGGHGRAPV